jgi:hypothetical protein
MFQSVLAVQMKAADAKKGKAVKAVVRCDKKHSTRIKTGRVYWVWLITPENAWNYYFGVES